MRDLEVSVNRVEAVAYTIPTDALESDGTREWDSTTFLVVHVHAGGEVGLGYTYGPSSVAHLCARLGSCIRVRRLHELRRRARGGAADPIEPARGRGAPLPGLAQGPPGPLARRFGSGARWSSASGRHGLA